MSNKTMSQRDIAELLVESDCFTENVSCKGHKHGVNPGTECPMWHTMCHSKEAIRENAQAFLDNNPEPEANDAN